MKCCIKKRKKIQIEQLMNMINDLNSRIDIINYRMIINESSQLV